MSYLPHYSHSKSKIEVELDLHNYATTSLKRLDQMDWLKKLITLRLLIPVI